MQPLRTTSLGIALASWAGAILLAGRPLPLTLPGALVPIAALAALVAGGLALAVARGVVTLGEDREARLTEAGLVGLPLAIALARVSGGPASAAVVAASVAVLALGQARGLRWGAIAAVGTMMLLVFPLGAPRDAASLAVSATLLAAVGLVPVWLAQRGSAQVDQAVRRTAQLERFLGVPRATPGSVAAVQGALRHEIIRAHAEDADRNERSVLAQTLADIADLHGAELAVYWRFTPARDQLVATAWTGDGPAPELTEAWATHVEWAAREGLVALDAKKAPSIAAAPLELQAGELLGALSLHARSGLRSPPARLRVWLPRHAVELTRLAALLETTRELSSESLRLTTILVAAQRFQKAADEKSLGRAICEQARLLTRGSRAILVHWQGPDAEDRVAWAEGDGVPAAGTVVAATSFVAEHGRADKPQVWEDARHALGGRRLIGPGESHRQVGSLGIYPLKNRKGQVHGAIVVEAEEPHAVLVKDDGTVNLLASYASLALQDMWEIASATHESRTDKLTGLYNRRHFDEMFRYVRGQYERHRQPCSLVIADVDRFKSVNDTYGHDTGDAVLRAVAAVFREGVREVDICARFGGEEIAVLLPSTPLERAVELAERLRVALASRTIRHGGRELRVTASFGVATYPDAAPTWEALFTAADRALYEAKHGGRNCVRTASPNAAQLAT